MNNGLELKTVKSTVKKGDLRAVKGLLEKIKALENHFVTAYLSYGVFIGYVKQGEIVFYSKDIDLKHLTEIRVFNKEEELYAYKDGDNFKYRLRKDEEGEEISVIDANQIVLGTCSDKTHEKKEGWTRITEKRGSELYVPFDINLSIEKRLAIHTRHYIEYNKCGQATYTDSRILGFKIFGKEEYMEVQNG